MTQQAVSQRIRSLEKSMGLTLIVRSSRGSTTTPVGNLIIEWAAALLSASDMFTAAVNALQHERKREFRVAASLTIAEHLVPRWLTRWHASSERPIVQLTAANSSAVIDLVRRGDVDLGFIETPDIPTGLNSAPVAHDQLLVVTAPTHPWTKKHTVTPEQLAATPLLAREEGSGTRRTLERALAAAEFHSIAPPAAVIPSALGIRTTAAAGYAPAVLSALTVNDDIQAGRLVRIHVDGLDLKRPLTAIWNSDPTADTTRFLHTITESRSHLDDAQNRETMKSKSIPGSGNHAAT